jgi:outer membrane biosynthesis protein TonB
MNDDFQQRYLDAEQAYGAGDYRRAATITEQLLQELKSVPAGGDNDEARLAWRAFVALLLGHVQFHGLKDPIAANGPYRLVLDSQPSDTLRELAEQGLEACEQTAPEPPPSQANQADALTRDPFLSEPAVLVSTQEVTPSSATPWLDTATPTVEDATPPEPQPPEEPEPIKPETSEPSPPTPAPQPDPLLLLEGALLRLDLRDR